MRRGRTTCTLVVALALLSRCGSGAPDTVQPVAPVARLRGTYTYIADAGRFTECGTGKAYPVAQKRVVVDQVERVGPDTACAGPAAVKVENSYWKVTVLGGRPARVVDNIPEPHLLLHPAQKRASGSTGCNRFSGTYQLGGDSLRFGQLVSTRRACLDPDLSRQEQAFLEALDETRTWRVMGDTLVLSGEAGPVARFVVQYLR